MFVGVVVCAGSRHADFFLYVTTQLALQLQQERTQVVCSNEKPGRLRRKRPEKQVEFHLDSIFRKKRKVFCN